MPTASLDQTRARVDAAESQASGLDALRQLHRQLLQRVSSLPEKSELLQEIAAVLSEHAEPEAVEYFERNRSGELVGGHQLRTPADDRMSKQLLSICQTACGKGEVELREQAAPARLLIGAPVALRGQGAEAIGVAFSGGAPPANLILLIQTVVSHLVLWHVLRESRAQEASANDSAVLLELLERIERSSSLRGACHALAGELQEYFNCGRAVVGIRRNGKGRCRVAAMSEFARFDRRSQTVQLIEAAFDEAIIRDSLTVWPTTDADARPGTLAHKAICSNADARSAVSIPLRSADSGTIGALIVLDEPEGATEHIGRFLQAAEPSLATSLAVIQRLEGSWLSKYCRYANNCWKSWKGKVAVAAVALSIAAMAIPLPYKVSCECQIEPVTKRFVAAPFEGTLEKSFVKPGDVVRQGEMLARLDGREIRWERASVEADRSQALKQRDAARATHKYAEAQIASLEMQRLDLQLQILDHRSQNLEIRSPIDGVVASGDLDRAEGAPLTIGQTLFEIAPLEKMIVEVSVEDGEISHIAVGQTVEVRLDAFPDETWDAVVTKVHPRSEIRNEANVFVAEVELDNADGKLRPGMKGRAKVVTHDRPLGWVLFHKPWEFAAKKLTW